MVIWSWIVRNDLGRAYYTTFEIIKPRNAIVGVFEIWFAFLLSFLDVIQEYLLDFELSNTWIFWSSTNEKCIIVRSVEIQRQYISAC